MGICVMGFTFVSPPVVAGDEVTAVGTTLATFTGSAVAVVVPEPGTKCCDICPPFPTLAAAVVRDTELTLLGTEELISLLRAVSVVACCTLTGVVGVVGVIGMFACLAAAANMEVPLGTIVGTTLLMVNPRGK